LTPEIDPKDRKRSVSKEEEALSRRITPRKYRAEQVPLSQCKPTDGTVSEVPSGQVFSEPVSQECSMDAE